MEMVEEPKRGTEILVAGAQADDLPGKRVSAGGALPSEQHGQLLVCTYRQNWIHDVSRKMDQ